MIRRIASRKLFPKGCCYSTTPRLSQWQPVIGLEFHCQIAGQSKLFSRTPVSVFSPPNTAVGWFDSAQPGTLPRLNRRCVEAAVMAALALKADINEVSYFDRKHYFYPDLPAGYQITQQRVPVALFGKLSFVVLPPSGDPYVHTAQLERLHIEEDSGRSIRDRENNRVLVDLNRAGIGLIEFVFAPCLSTAEEAVALAKRLADLLGRLGVCSPKLSDSNLRVDTNVSVKRVGEPNGVRTEIKNLNSTKVLLDAINYEVERHISILAEGGTVVSETRGYDETNNSTVRLRGKEGLQDYRFMPEPNLPPLYLCDSHGSDDVSNSKDVLDINTIRHRLPDLPTIEPSVLDVLIKEHQLIPYLAESLMMESDVLNLYLKSAVEILKTSTDTSIFILVARSLINTWNTLDQRLRKNWGLDPAAVSRLCLMSAGGEVLASNVVKVLQRMSQPGCPLSPEQILEAENWLLIGDTSTIKEAATHIILTNSELVNKYHKLNKNIKKQKRPLGKLVRLTSSSLGDKVSPDKIEEILEKLLITMKEVNR